MRPRGASANRMDDTNASNDPVTTGQLPPHGSVPTAPAVAVPVPVDDAMPAGTLSRQLVWASMAFCALPVVIVNFWIYRALAVYAANNPEIIARRSVTISRAITDPSIADTFAIWITISAVLLVPGVGLVARLYVRAAARTAAQASAVVRLAYAMVALQVASGIGMAMLSWFRFPDHDALHMAGSYLHFISQALVVLCFALASRILYQARDGLWPIQAPMARVRVWLGAWVMALAVGYLGLFILKDVPIGAWERVIYRIYTMTEPALISSFLLAFATHLIDLARLLRRA